MNASPKIAVPAPVTTAAKGAAIAMCNTVNATSSTLNSAVSSIGRLAAAADLKSEEWLFGVQASVAKRKPYIVNLAELAVLTEVGAKLLAHQSAMKDPDFATAFQLAVDMGKTHAA